MRSKPWEAPDDLLEWYDNLLESHISWDETGCEVLGAPMDVPSNRTLGPLKEPCETSFREQVGQTGFPKRGECNWWPPKTV